MFVCVHVCECLCVCVYVYVCAYVCVCISVHVHSAGTCIYDVCGGMFRCDEEQLQLCWMGTRIGQELTNMQDRVEVGGA